MPANSYKILVAKRLAIDPNALLMYFETENFAIVTTPDGQQHSFSKSELDRPRPAIPVAKTPQKGPDPASAADQLINLPSKKVAPLALEPATKEELKSVAGSPHGDKPKPKPKPKK